MVLDIFSQVGWPGERLPWGSVCVWGGEGWAGDTLPVKITLGSILKDRPRFSQSLCWAQLWGLPFPDRTVELGACLAPGLERGQAIVGGWPLGEKASQSSRPEP